MLQGVFLAITKVFLVDYYWVGNFLGALLACVAAFFLLSRKKSVIDSTETLKTCYMVAIVFEVLRTLINEKHDDMNMMYANVISYSILLFLLYVVGSLYKRKLLLAS